MAPNAAAFTRVVTTSTAAASVVAGGATGSATTGTGGFYGGFATLNSAAAPLVTPLSLQGGGAIGAYTLVNSGVVYLNAAGTEQYRIWGTDPSRSNNNSANLYIGYRAGHAQPTANTSGSGSDNLGIGWSALLSNTSGDSNLAIGVLALGANTTGSNNLAIGVTALEDCIIGTFNTAIGVSALANCTGDFNTAIGPNALATVVTGANNTAVGSDALWSTTGSSNAAFGESALRVVAAGSDNTGLGGSALINMTSGSSNVAIGYRAGRQFTGPTNLTTATQAVLIGALTRPSANANTNEIVIGYNADGNGSNTVTIGNASATAAYLPASLTLKVDGSNNLNIGVSAAGAVTFNATGASAGFSFSDSVTLANPFLMTSAISPTQLVANTDNWNPTDLATANVIRINVSGAIDLSGIVAQTSGRMVVLYNTSTHDVTLIHDATSTAANRFYCPNATNFTLSQKESTWLRYDGTDSRWTVFGT